MAILPDFRDFQGRYNPVICHSAKGTAWKNHKYITIKNGRYIYPDDMKDNLSSDSDEKSTVSPTHNSQSEKIKTITEKERNRLDKIYKQYESTMGRNKFESLSKEDQSYLKNRSFEDPKNTAARIRIQTKEASQKRKQISNETRLENLWKQYNSTMTQTEFERLSKEDQSYLRNRSSDDSKKSSAGDEARLEKLWKQYNSTMTVNEFNSLSKEDREYLRNRHSGGK